MGVTTKILTGDNEKVTLTVCEKVGLPVDKVLLGTEIEDMSDEELAAVAEETTILQTISRTKGTHYSFTKSKRTQDWLHGRRVSMMRHP